MTTRVETFRAHCARMATAEHKPECPSLTAREPYWSEWSAEYIDGEPMQLRWLGPKPRWEPPTCDGCLTDDERALFARMAAEAAAYQQGELEGTG